MVVVCGGGVWWWCVVVVCGGDNTWSDDCARDGMNWFGLQLMLMRDELRGTSGDGSWTEYIRCQSRRDNGYDQTSDVKIEDEIMDARISNEISRWMEEWISRSFQ